MSSCLKKPEIHHMTLARKHQLLHYTDTTNHWAKHDNYCEETSATHPCETVSHLSDHEPGDSRVSAAVARCSAIPTSRGSTVQLMFAEDREPLYGVRVLRASDGRAILRLTVARISELLHVAVGRNYVALQRSFEFHHADFISMTTR